MTVFITNLENWFFKIKVQVVVETTGLSLSLSFVSSVRESSKCVPVEGKCYNESSWNWTPAFQSAGFSPVIIRIFRTGGMRWEKHTARIGRGECTKHFGWKRWREESRGRPRCRWDNIEMGLTGIRCDGVDRIHMVQDRIQLRHLVNTLIKLGVPLKARNFLDQHNDYHRMKKWFCYTKSITLLYAVSTALLPKRQIRLTDS
jgi:hypothetical protein